MLRRQQAKKLPLISLASTARNRDGGNSPRPVNRFTWKLIDTVFVLLFVLFAFLLARFYIGAERFFLLLGLRLLYRPARDGTWFDPRKLVSGRGCFPSIVSNAEEYNQYFTLPLLPFALPLGGLTRARFVEALAVLYVVPLCLTVGSITISLFSTTGDERLKRTRFWIGALFCLLLPATWAAVLRAYPDVLSWLFYPSCSLPIYGESDRAFRSPCSHYRGLPGCLDARAPSFYLSRPRILWGVRSGSSHLGLGGRRAEPMGETISFRGVAWVARPSALILLFC